MDLRAKQDVIDLGGPWSFAFADAADTRCIQTLDDLRGCGLAVHPASVPGNFELDLQAAGLLEEPFYALNMLHVAELERSQVWYARSFQFQPRDGFDADLVFEGVDCYADVYLNGQLLGSCDNMLIEHVFPGQLLRAGENQLVVHIRPAVVEAAKYDYPALLGCFGSHVESLYVRKAPHMYGWDIMPRAVSAGLWRPVRVRYRPVERIEEAYMETGKLLDSNTGARVRLSYRTNVEPLNGSTYEMRIQGRCEDSEFDIRRPMRFSAGQIWFDFANCRLWWPRGYGKANLYDVIVTLLKDGRPIDHIEFRHGIRTVELVRTSITTADGQGDFHFRVNGAKVFCRGSNHVPADAFHSRDAGRLGRIVALAAELECNILRCWGGNVYENDLFFDLCDKAGIMVWQDFTMACAIYPQDEDFCRRMTQEATTVVKRLRQHASIVLWSGDNECDLAWGWNHRADPNKNVLTRKVLPDVLYVHDPMRPYLPSSPYLDEAAVRAGEDKAPEQHLWGPRDYYKSEFYRTTIAHFASEIGYHGCPPVESLRQFLSPQNVWPYDNSEWVLHSTNPLLGTEVVNPPDYRVKLMINQVRCVFETVPDKLEDFIFASQFVQGEALKYFVERFRGGKWRRTGIIWWNIIDGWPSFSDAIVDYYFRKKLAYQYLKASQQPVSVMVRETNDGRLELVAANDTLESCELQFTVRDVESMEPIVSGTATATANETTLLSALEPQRSQAFWVLQWKGPAGQGRSHYLLGKPPFKLADVRTWLSKSGLYAE